MALTNEPVHHITLENGRRFYCRVLRKQRGAGAAWFGATGHADEVPDYQAITKNLPWEVTPAGEVPDNMKPGGMPSSI